MGWEKRQDKLYYYRKQRVNGRVRSVYMGCGEKAILASLEDGVALPVAQAGVTNIRDVKKGSVLNIQSVKKDAANISAVKKEPQKTSDSELLPVGTPKKESESFDLFAVPVGEIPPEQLWNYMFLLRCRIQRETDPGETGRLVARRYEIEGRGRELTARIILIPRVYGDEPVIESKLRQLAELVRAGVFST